MIAKNTERFEMRMDPPTLAAVDKWRSDQSDFPSRAKAIRRLVRDSLDRSAGRNFTMTDSERLLAFMLVDMHKKLNIEDGLDPDFIEYAIGGGHYWALRWQYPGIFHGEEDKPDTVNEVCEILDMWYFLEDGFNKLSKKDKEKVKQEAKPFGENVKFPGFDGNTETEHMSIARFLIHKMERYTEFKDHELNSHSSLLEIYRRMLSIFRPMLANLKGGKLSASQIISILKERTHPENR